MSQYKSGTVSVTNGSPSIVGDDTLWSANVAAGQTFIIAGSGVPYIIGAVTDDTHITLTANYAGSTQSGLSYEINTSRTPLLGIDYMEMGDIDTATTFKRAMLEIEGILTSGVLYAAEINDIGIMGARGACIGICPAVPPGYAGLYGYTDIASDNYGNYQYADGSVMCWIPLHCVKYGTGANGLAANQVDIKPYSYFGSVAAANAAGYFIPRDFYDNNTLQQGYFYDKFKCSNNGGVASSIRFGNSLSSNGAHNSFSSLNGAPPNFYYGAFAAAKTRGPDFFPRSLFMGHTLNLLSIAHAQASSSTTYCAWYNATYNTPKGCNNNALGDDRDASILYLSDGYSNAAKTGSANQFAKTTHNGQACGVADVNGGVWEIAPGLTTDAAGTTFYILKLAAQMKALTGGNTGATDHWGATGIAALFDALGATYGALMASSTVKYLGNAAQVFSEAVNGTAWAAAGAGIPLIGGTGGTNAFGSDGIWDYRVADMCAVASGDWSNSGSSGPGALGCAGARGDSASSVGLRLASYLPT